MKDKTKAYIIAWSYITFLYSLYWSIIGLVVAWPYWVGTAIMQVVGAIASWFPEGKVAKDCKSKLVVNFGKIVEWPYRIGVLWLLYDNYPKIIASTQFIILLCFAGILVIVAAIYYFYSYKDRKENSKKTYVKVKTKFYKWADKANAVFEPVSYFKEQYRDELNASEEVTEFLAERLQGVRPAEANYYAFVGEDGNWNYEGTTKYGMMFNTVHVDKELIISETPMKFDFWKGKVVPV